MKLLTARLGVLALALGSLVIPASNAGAANSFYTPGDLMLFFQREGSTQTVYVSLGNTATVFRDATTDINDLVNINSALNTAFGASWGDLTDLYVGLAGVWGTSQTNSSLQNGDPHRTLYVSQPRSIIGSPGTPGSSGYTVNTNTGMGTGASFITSMGAPFDDASGVNGYNSQTVVSPTSVSNIDDQNPFLAPGIQGTAFGIFGGGVQQVGAVGLYATSFGSDSNVEFALDLYRIQARNDIAGQFGQGDAIRTGTFEGTVTIDSLGNVSFIAIPEPSTYALLGLGALAAAIAFSRRSKSQA